MEHNNLPFLNVSPPIDENDEDEVLEILEDVRAKTLAELLYDCYLTNNFDAKLVHKQNQGFVLYFEEDVVLVKNLAENDGSDLTLTEVQCIWSSLDIKEVNYFNFNTIGYEILSQNPT